MSTISYATPASFDANSHPQISVGGNNPVIKLFRNCLNVPYKIIHWNSGFGSGNVTEQSARKVENYLKENGLEEVQVQVNEWDPVKHVGRVFSNPKTGIVSKLTFGVLSSLGYILTPNKLFLGLDYYDLMSDDVHLFSNDEGFNLKPAIEAKRVSGYDYPVLSSLAEAIPFIGCLLTLDRQNTDKKEAQKHLNKHEKDHRQARLTEQSVNLASNMRGYASLALSHWVQIPMALLTAATLDRNSTYLDAQLAAVRNSSLAALSAIVLAHINS